MRLPEVAHRTLRVNARSRGQAIILAMDALVRIGFSDLEYQVVDAAGITALMGAMRTLGEELRAPPSSLSLAWEVDVSHIVEHVPILLFSPRHGPPPSLPTPYVFGCASGSFLSERPHDNPDVDMERGYWVAIALAIGERTALAQAAPCSASSPFRPRAP